MSRIELFVVIAIGLILVVMLLTPVHAVFDGEYVLRITVENVVPESTDKELVFGYVWTATDYERLVTGLPDAILHSGEMRQLDSTTFEIQIPYSGRPNVSYHEPELLVVGLLNDEESWPPKQLWKFKIPSNRGDRSMTVVLP